MAVRGPLKSAKIPRRWKKVTHRIASPLAKTALALFTCVFLAVLIWKYPQWLSLLRSITDPKERLTLENEILKTMIQIVGGAFLLGGLYFTWRNTYLLKEGQITERFNKAIDHLGDDKPEVRLGGIYALARIARDSEKDHWPTMEVLCAFVRNRTKAGVPVDCIGSDTQAALNVLAERSADFETEEQCLDLRNVNLKGADLRGAFLDRARFGDSNLEGVDLMQASLVGADFRGAHVRGAHLRQARLQGANFVGADLQDASLREASLCNANLLGVRLDNATLIGADLTGAQYVTKEQLSSAITDGSTRLPQFLEVSQVSASS